MSSWSKAIRAPAIQAGVYRAAVGKPLLHPPTRRLSPLPPDEPLPGAPIPVVNLDDIESIIDILLRHAVPLESGAAAAM